VSLPFFAIEPVRERRYPRPLLRVASPLANFALTLETARSETADQNLQILVLLGLTFMRHSETSVAFYRRVWNVCRGLMGHKLRALIVASLLAGRFVPLL